MTLRLVILLTVIFYFNRDKASLTAQFAAAHGASLPSTSATPADPEEERRRREAGEAERRRIAQIAKDRAEAAGQRKAKQELTSSLRQY